MARRIVVTGGAGFIGSNYVDRLLNRGEHVRIYDNLSRGGAAKNLAWIDETHGVGAYELVVGDVRDAALLTSSLMDADVIVHLASQVAVTTSVQHPREDFEINALGTFNVMEAARLAGHQPVVIYASSNKVYGGMDDTPLVEQPTRWAYADLPGGVPETQQLDFHSPYGCSKGAGDQYVRDYQRVYGIPSVVFRQGAIYGPRQFGIEDQGWVAWFIIAAVLGRPITIFGDGKQVRDLCHVDDLMDAYDAAIDQIDSVSGQVFNVGGGAANTLSIWVEFKPLLEKLLGRSIPVKHDDWRPGDQRVNINNIEKAGRALGWDPQVDVKTGISRLFEWVYDNQALFN
jgi:CDP-paratose 2-epimerase